MGNNDHPLKPFFELPSDPAYHINCSYQNGINFYNFGLANGGSSTNCPALLLSIKEINNSVQPIKISPNPFAIETTLQIDKMLIGSTLTIFNVSGQQIKQIKNITDETITLYRYDLQSGFYYMQLTKDNKSYSSKIVITDN